MYDKYIGLVILKYSVRFLFVNLGCYNKNITAWVKSYRNLLLTVMEVGKPKIKAAANLVSAKGPLPCS